MKLLERLLKDRYTLRQSLTLWDQRSYVSLRHLTRQSLQCYVQQTRSYPLAKKGHLILVIDGKWFRFQGKEWVLYLMALRPVNSSQAVLMDPVLLPGKEYSSKWRKVFQTLPLPFKSRVCALVSDGLRGINTLANEQGWVYQRCHFHLLREALLRLGVKRKSPSSSLRLHIFQTLREFLIPQNEKSLSLALEQLYSSVNQPELSSRCRRVLRDFLRHRFFFHTYRQYPQYHLPTTTNALESYSSLLAKRLSSIRSPKALLLWTTAFIRMNPTITCNGKQNQQN
jgi:hypothetical protein